MAIQRATPRREPENIHTNDTPTPIEARCLCHEMMHVILKMMSEQAAGKSSKGYCAGEPVRAYSEEIAT